MGGLAGGGGLCVEPAAGPVTLWSGPRCGGTLRGGVQIRSRVLVCVRLGEVAVPMGADTQKREPDGGAVAEVGR